MATRPRNVDLGPLYLQVGEENVPQSSESLARNADAGDVARFESIMHRKRGQERRSEVTPEMLLASPLEPELAHLAEPHDICHEIAHLWVGTGLQSDREVRMALREALLPQTSVRLCEVHGRLRIEFTCATHRVADWLDRKLQVLARELGQRLERPLELAVFMADGSCIGERNWPEIP